MAHFVARYGGPGGTALTLYGPFSNEKQAQEANFFGNSQADFNKALKEHSAKPWEIGVHSYDRDDLANLQDDPEAYNYRSVTVKPAQALKVHPSWRTLLLDRHRYFMYVTTGDTSWLEKTAGYDFRKPPC